jgi:phosphatidate cytidylyltransferase
MARSETTQRLMVAAIGIPVAVGAVVLGGWVLAVLLAVLAALGTLEFYRMAATRDVAPLRLLGATLAAAFVALASAGPEMGPNAVGFALLIVVGFLLASVSSIWARGVEGRTPSLGLHHAGRRHLHRRAALASGCCSDTCPAHEGALHGTVLVLAPVMLTWASDTFAYFAGSHAGAPAS